VGFKYENGEFSDIDPIAAMLNPAALHEVLHMTFAATVATGFMVAGIHAYFLLRNSKSEFHRAAFGIAAAMACVSIPLQVLTGDLAARRVAKYQPMKLAAMEAHYETRSHAPFVIGGIPDDETKTTKHGLEIPNALSLLIGHSADTVVPGLDQIPREEWPNVKLVHWSFDVMVGCGMVMLGLALWAGVAYWKKRGGAVTVRLLKAFLICAPLGFIALEAGWFVTEFGRQPWIIYGIMKTSEAVTPMPNLVVPFTTFTIVYIFLSVVLVFLLRRQFMETAPEKRGGA
jgi:cytochrome d ubiquinol oxidase subunit I